MSKVRQSTVKVVFLDDVYRVEGKLTIPSGTHLADYLNRHARFLPVNEVKYISLLDDKQVQQSDFAYLNAEKFHSVIPKSSPDKGGYLPVSVSLQEVMTSKLHTVNPQTTVIDAFNLMRQHKIHHLPVLDKTRLVGLITKSDLGMLVWHRHEEPIEKFMKKEILTIDISASFEDAIKEMVAREVTCLPILKGKQVMGIVTQRDLFKFIYKDIFSRPLKS